MTLCKKKDVFLLFTYFIIKHTNRRVLWLARNQEFKRWKVWHAQIYVPYAQKSCAHLRLARKYYSIPRHAQKYSTVFTHAQKCLSCPPHQEKHHKQNLPLKKRYELWITKLHSLISHNSMNKRKSTMGKIIILRVWFLTAGRQSARVAAAHLIHRQSSSGRDHLGPGNYQNRLHPGPRRRSSRTLRSLH